MSDTTQKGGSATVGNRVRSFREARGMDRETLARDASLSVEFLERLENGEVYPSIGPMQKVARALGLRLGTFLDDQFTRDPIISSINGSEAVICPHTGSMPTPSYIYHALGKGKNDRNMEPFFIEIYPNAEGAVRKTSSHQGEEFIFVLEGELLVVYGRENHILRPGQTIYYNSIVPHYVGPANDKPVRILAVTYNP